MKYLKIQNSGELDIRLVALMGGTTKSKDKFKIGQFGTGLKYTLAYLYRNNIDFKIFSGTEEINIGLQIEKINDIDFEIICINGNRTSITTQMGQQWTAWMIIRELWCNALDEGQPFKAVVTETELIGEGNKTSFYLQLTPEMQLVLDEWNNYFIQNQVPISENDKYAIYINNKETNLRLYKHGVLIYSHPSEQKSLFCYDVKSAEINELREFKGYVSYEIYKALESPSKEAVSYFLNHITDKHYEGSELDYDWFSSFGDIWREAVGDNKISKSGDSGYYNDQGIAVDFSNVIELPKKVYTALIKDFEGIGALALTDDNTEFYETADYEIEEKVNECINALLAGNYILNPDTIIRYGVFREHTRKHSANRNKKTIMISEVCKSLTQLELAQIIIEGNEYVHLNENKDSPKFFRHFISLYARQLLTSTPIEI